jgi:hypothetical protein
VTLCLQLRRFHTNFTELGQILEILEETDRVDLMTLTPLHHFSYTVMTANNIRYDEKLKILAWVAAPSYLLSCVLTERHAMKAY